MKQVLVVENVKKVATPAKNRKFPRQSELNVIEPEYVVWDSTSEPYPIIFESIGDWDVTTSVAPPEGFVSDFDSLSAVVNTDYEAVQFTITEVGSLFADTFVCHEIEHNGQTIKHAARVGVKLTAAFAAVNGLNEDGSPQDRAAFKLYERQIAAYEEELEKLEEACLEGAEAPPAPTKGKPPKGGGKKK